MESVTVYVTSAQAVRKTADDCRRLVALIEALDMRYESVVVDSDDMQSFVEEHTQRKGQLPLLTVGDACVGSFDEVMGLIEDGALAQRLRELGYAGHIRGAPAGVMPVSGPAKVVVKTVVKKVIVRKKADSEKEAAEPSTSQALSTSAAAAAQDDALNPPPAADDVEDDIPPPPLDDAIPPPPPDMDEDDWEAPPPPPDDSLPPPPPPEDDDDAPPPPPPE